jgi:hypothetical protein
MDERIDAIYRRNEILPNTERGQVGGPFSYGMTRNAATYRESRADLTFFDVAGEDCVDMARSADIARYIFDATGIVLLIDPGGLPRPGGSPITPRGTVSLTSRAIVDNLANAMESVTGVKSRDLEQVISIAIAKADSVSLPVSVWPPRFWLEEFDGPLPPTEIRHALESYSQQCRSVLASLGGSSIISAAETRFDKENIYYSAVSATSQQPLDGTWYMPEPIGCSIPLAQILTFGDTDQN